MSDVGVGGLQNSYDSSATYIVGQSVISGGIVYTAILNVPVNEPPPNGTYWEVVPIAPTGPASKTITLDETSATATLSAGFTYLSNHSAGASTYTLPANPQDGATITVKKIDSGAHTITLSSSANIDGASTFVIADTQFDSATVRYDGNADTWWVISGYVAGSP